MIEIFLTSSPCIPGIEEARLNPENDFIDRLKLALPWKPRVLTIASTPGSELTVFYAKELEKACLEAGIPFAEHRILNGGSRQEARRLIGWADFIILSGGHVPTQNAFFRQIGLKELLWDFDGVLMGISAGSMNSAEYVYAHPEEEGEAIDPEYQRWLPGLGLTDIQILPHYQMTKDDVLDGLRIYEDIAYPDSYGNHFLVLPDGSYVHICDGETNIYGEGYWLADGEMLIASPGGRYCGNRRLYKKEKL